ncbi:MAG: hypothetical protein GWM90_16430 [Gemmatimonadetes bacterium]|nr:hypothetical protein [Gemmatimonadota bacterium]NIQ55863.1 hypothetical protein [Gemmatimonadota bacterium]NIU76062.1 hypothetical protein [Gammaproteobacteria bacterium]NIX45628.1 hypothetical protein [Gemmatimonadota bacterium]NIY09916.1 hypothetical protein [Gemmatimonadota bacterium]
MLPDPLHPAIVHFPIVLAVLLPAFAVGALWAIRRGARPGWAWAVPLALAAVLAGSSWLAVETGEAQEDRVEDVVGEQVLHAHEEAGERFLVLSGILLLIMGAGLLKGRAGSASRLVGTVGAAALVIAAVQVGDAGGKLVYEHGAAAAYASPDAGGAALRPGEHGVVPASGRVDRGEGDEDED